MKNRLISSVMSRLAQVIALLAIATAQGCGPAPQAEEQQANLKPLAILYGKYVAAKRSNPKNEADFRAFLDKLKPEELSSLGVTSVDTLFTSSRDGKPYVVRYGKYAGPPGPAGQPVVAYEAEGKDGKRFVASTLGAVDSVDDARFRTLVPDAP